MAGPQHFESPEIAYVRKIAGYWARGEGLELDPGGHKFKRREDALFVPLDPESEREFAAGDGGELEKLGSLRSSAAMAYNVFAPWKTAPSQLARLLGGEGVYDRMAFERKYPTGVGSRHPHLDVVIETNERIRGGPMPVAVEAKFCEIYDRPSPARFSVNYLRRDELWAGLENMRRLAEELAANAAIFELFGAAQLVKHILGLAREYGPSGFRLVYLWYDFASEAAKTHRGEVDRFSEMLDGEISFQAMTYQDLYLLLSRIDEPVPGYLRFLSGRYGLG